LSFGGHSVVIRRSFGGHSWLIGGRLVGKKDAVFWANDAFEVAFGNFGLKSINK